MGQGQPLWEGEPPLCSGGQKHHQDAHPRGLSLGGDCGQQGLQRVCLRQAGAQVPRPDEWPGGSDLPHQTGQAVILIRE